MKLKEAKNYISLLLKEQEDKIASGEIVCNSDSPEDCKMCSG